MTRSAKGFGFAGDECYEHAFMNVVWRSHEACSQKALSVHAAVNLLLQDGMTHRAGPVARMRVQGYREALHDAGLTLRDEWIATGRTEKHAGFSGESGYEAMQALPQADPGVTAVLASSDVQAIGAWQALREGGLSVPDDVALVGYDDIKVSRFIGLSSVAQNMHDIGEAATDLLLRRLHREGPSEAFSQLVVPELMVRSSS